jgi:hypothetical protein
VSIFSYRWPCSVPGCKRSIGADRPMETEIGDWCLCAKHWPLTPKPLKRMMRRAARRWDHAHARATIEFVDGRRWCRFISRDYYMAEQRAREAYLRLSRLAVRKAIEASMGIG